jgi:hypothetical protein
MYKAAEVGFYHTMLSGTLSLGVRLLYGTEIPFVQPAAEVGVIILPCFFFLQVTGYMYKAAQVG